MAFDIDKVAGYGPADAPATDAGPEARKARGGMRPAPKTDDELGIDRGPQFYRGVGERGKTRDAPAGLLGSGIVPSATQAPGTAAYAAAHVGDEMNDPGAQLLTAGALAAPAAAVIGAAAPAAVAPIVSGATSGAEQAAMTGQSPVTGAIIGGASGIVPVAQKALNGGLAPAADAAAARMATRESSALYRQVGRASDPTVQRELEKVGEEGFQSVAEKNGIIGAKDPRAAAQEALAKSEAGLRAAQTAQETAQWDALPPEERLYRQVGQLGGPNAKAKIDAIGKDKVVGALQRAGVSSMPDAATAAPTIKAAQANVGKQIGSAYSALDSSGARWSTVRQVLDAAEKVRASKAATVATQPEADAIDRWMKDFMRANKGSESTPISAAQLNREIGGLQANGFAARGVELPQSVSAKLGRDLSGALDDVLDQHIGRAAKFSPTASATANELRQLNQDYRVLRTVRPLVTGRAAAERFAAPGEQGGEVPIDRVMSKLGPGAAAQVAEYRVLRAISQSFDTKAAGKAFGPTAGERLGTAIAHPGEAAGKLVSGAAQLPAKAAGGVANAADVAIAKLFGAKMTGTMTPQLLDEAARAGVAPATIAFFGRVRQSQ